MSMSDRDDARLAEASLHGDREAFGAIVERYQNLVCSIAYSAVGDLGSSEDIAQETFVAAWRQLAQLRDRMKLRSWLVGIARNVARNHLRKDRKNPAAQATAIEAIGDLADAQRSSPLEEAINAEHLAIVSAALARVPEMYREPLVLYYREGRNVQQVAEALDLGEEAVKTRLHRGRAMLKEEVNRFVEDALVKTRPGKVFTIAVLAALPAAASTAAAATAVGSAAGKGAAAAKTVLAAGVSGAILGPLLGGLGTIYGAMASISNTRSPRERRFMVWMTCGVLALAVLFCLGLHAIVRFVVTKHPSTETAVWLIGGYSAIYLSALAALILFGNRRQRRIQIEEGTYVDPWRTAPTPGALQIPRANIYASLGGSIFGGMAWLMVVSWVLKDWLILGVTAVGTVGLFLFSTRRCVRSPQNYYRFAIHAVFAMAVYSLAVLNLRWNQWRMETTLPHSDTSNWFGAGGARERWALSAIIAAIYFFLWQRFYWVFTRNTKPAKHDTN